jgi:hypothetical protein
MRALLAMALIAGGALALPDPADARRVVRNTPGYYYTAQPRYRYYQQRHYRPRYYQPYGQPYGYYAPPPPRYYSREQAVCEERAQNEDPAGVYAGYPCWARSAFSRGGGGGRR